ncbi:MAG: response regulator transcription factor [Peptococcaceae bacterium]|nr:response regulator transcription factor [Peptococcaceae bacterium]
MRIILADDHRILREGLQALFKNKTGMEVVAEAKDGREAVRLARDFSPDVIIMDISMPGLNGIEATRRIIAEHPKIKVVALSMHSSRRFVVEMFKAGASGYLLKDCDFEELVYAINTVMDDQLYISASISSIMIKDYVHTLKSYDYSVYSILTPREREVLQLIAEGKTTAKIASLLSLSEKTVETHRRQLMHKLNLYSVAELTKYAISEGLTSV